MDRPSQTYSCQNVGCSNGFGSSFEAAPEEWFKSKGMTLPKNCPACKTWKDSQTDELRRCAECREPVRITANFKKSYHKSIGPWQAPRECQSCRRGVNPPTSSSNRTSEQRRRQKARSSRQERFSDLPLRELEPRTVITDLSRYQYMISEAHGSRVTRQVHLERHLVGSPNSLTNPVRATAAGLRRPKSPTSLAGNNADVSELLENISVLSLSTDPQMIREYVIPARQMQGNRPIPDRIARVTFTGDQGRLEVTILRCEAGGDQYAIDSSYDGMSVADIHAKLDRDWQ